MNLDLFNDGISTYTGERDGADYYPTPPELLLPLLDRLPLYGSVRVLEPCAGRALSLARELEAHGHQVITGDVDPLTEVDVHGDLREHDWSQHGANICITNPPYLTPDGMHAADVVRHMLCHVDRAAFLLRLSFLEPCDNRVDLVCEGGGLAKVIIMPRVSFRGGYATDSMTTAWMLWECDHAGPWVGEVVSWPELERARIRIAERRSP